MADIEAQRPNKMSKLLSHLKSTEMAETRAHVVPMPYWSKIVGIARVVIAFLVLVFAAAATGIFGGFAAFGFTIFTVSVLTSACKPSSSRANSVYRRVLLCSSLATTSWPSTARSFPIINGPSWNWKSLASSSGLCPFHCAPSGPPFLIGASTRATAITPPPAPTMVSGMRLSTPPTLVWLAGV
jgi:hypothetical protein